MLKRFLCLTPTISEKKEQSENKQLLEFKGSQTPVIPALKSCLYLCSSKPTLLMWTLLAISVLGSDNAGP